ncbi:MAG TPA: ABC transporter permease [Gemmataceae bacterium]|nr:ABC transporter permease [Gemmataceae bacterium]
MSTGVGEIWQSRYFWLSLARQDLRDRYRRSVLGAAWSLIRPLAMTAIFCAALRGIFGREDVWSYAAYLMTGLVCWDYLANSARQGCQSLLRAERYVRQHPLPMAVYPLRTVLGETVQFLMTLVVVVLLCGYATHNLRVTALVSLVPALVLLFALAWSVAVLTSFLHVYFRDTEHLCDVFLQVFFYLTPIIYEVQILGAGRLGWLVRHCNPLLPFLDLMRTPLLDGHPPGPQTFAAAFAVVCAVGGLAALACNRLQRRLVFHL